MELQLSKDFFSCHLGFAIPEIAQKSCVSGAEESLRRGGRRACDKTQNNGFRMVDFWEIEVCEFVGNGWFRGLVRSI